MNATLAKKLRFSDVVYAIGTTPKSLRLWFQRDLVQIHTPKPEGGAWTEFTFIDIAILALVRTLVNFGVPVASASEIANMLVRDMSSSLMSRLKNPQNMPAGALAVLWTNARAQIYQDGEQWMVRRIPLYESALDPITHEGFNPAVPSGIAAIRSEIEPAPVFLTIDVETLLRTAFERAEESVNEGRDEASA